MKLKLLLLVVLIIYGIGNFIAATLHRNGSLDIAGADYGLMPANKASVGDILIVTSSGTSWVSLTNIVVGIMSTKAITNKVAILDAVREQWRTNFVQNRISLEVGP